MLRLLLILCLGVLTARAGEADAAAAAREALRSGCALCKIISPNDAGRTGSHQSGLYLPKSAWRFFSASAPVEDENRREQVALVWPDGTKSDAVISWYGKGTRSEYRLTRLGDAGGKFLTPGAVGGLFVLVPQGGGEFRVHVLDTEEEAEAFSSALGIETGARWSLYEKEPAPGRDGPYDAWAAREAKRHADFPTGKVMAELARQAVTAETPRVLAESADHKLLAWMDAEYAIFRAIERRLCDAQVRGKFASVEEFLTAAATIMNRRKSRAGHSLECHVEHLLSKAAIAFEAQALVDGQVKPDILLPGKAAYDDPQHPAEKLAVLGLKTTCRDRWRQVLNEGKRVPVKDLLTLQPAMSRAQLEEMQEAHLRLTVPAPLQASYDLPEGYKVLSVQELLDDLRRRFPR